MNGESDGWIESEIGWNLGRIGKHQEAIEYLKSCLAKKYYNSTWVKEEIAWNMAKLEKYQEALDLYEEVNRENPSDENRRNIEILENILKIK